MSNKNLAKWLFETKALRVCPENKPFWYTSGTIGPYYINTHFLYGSEEKANELLKTIDILKEDKLNCPGKLLVLIKENYTGDMIFKGLIDEMLDFVRNNIDISNVDYISGGERRDWFFSLIIADMLKKPHITIFKDMSAVVTSTDGKTEEIENITGDRVLHIADLITEASSYERAWIPVIKSLGGTIEWSVVVVDRKQGGGELLEKNNIKSLAMVSIDKALFSNALDNRLINGGQFQMLIEYTINPKESMKSFLHKHPEFLENSLNSDEKTKERAKLCLEKKFYE
jgi:orotate phosphoribosyltransferase